MKVIRLLFLAAAIVPLVLLGTTSRVGSTAGLQPRTLDDMFAQVGERAPAFGGFFLDANGGPTLYMVDTKQGPAAEAAVADVFGPEYLPPLDVRVLQAQYSFLQLKGWYDNMWGRVLAMDGSVFTDIDEANNRLHIAVESNEAREAVKAELAGLGVPLEAVNIELGGPIVDTSHTLQSYRRPVQGAYQIARSADGALCTMGFNAYSGSTRGFATNSHCTNVQGGVESTVLYQPTKSDSYRIGVETIDPTYWTGPPCPPGRRCRYSDSAFAAFDDNILWHRGYIARTTGLGSITVDHNNPQFRITADLYWPSSGVTVNKMGIATGWTQGTIVVTCANVNRGGTDITFICQDRATASQLEGDSGAPVFRITNSPFNGDVDLVGMAWGRDDATGTVWFSVLGAIEFGSELGTLNDCAAGYSC